MTYTIEIQNDDGYAIDAEKLRTAAQTALKHQGVPEDRMLTIVVTDDDAVRDLNRQFREVDTPTDILSFPFGDGTYLGDLVIAYPYARSQAEREGHPLLDNFMLLVVHGVLHLLGYDHDTAANRAQMWSEQAAILAKLGISDDLVPDLEQGTAHE